MFSFSSSKTSCSAEKRQSTSFVSEIAMSLYPTKAMDNEGKSVEIDSVRITPSITIFKNAFEGRQFKQKLVLQNCGKSPAFVRICPPTSHAFKIKTLERGKYLPPGLSIVRSISFTYIRASSIPCVCLPIYINKKYFPYNIVVTKSSCEVFSDPPQINFGNLNIGYNAVSRTVLLKNNGYKSSRFAIVLGTFNQGLSVTPTKGLILGMSFVPLTIEISSCEEGIFYQEVWVKCEMPFAIKVCANFIMPKLTVLSDNKTPDFAFVDFPKTYLKTSYTKFVVVKNNGALPNMFCVLAEIENEEADFKKAAEKEEYFRCFQISPLEGRLAPNEGRILEITFTPKPFSKTGNEDADGDYVLCFVRIMQVNCTDLQGIRFQDDAEMPAVTQASLPSSISNSSTSLSHSLDDSSYIFDEFLVREIPSEETVGKSFCNRLCLHGGFERAGIVVRPNALQLKNLPMNQQVNRELLLTNKSNSLPISFLYKKVANVDLEPSSGRLGPSEKLEVNVVISPTKLGDINTKIVFDLLHKNFSDDDYVVVGRKSVAVFCNVVAQKATPLPKFNLGITPLISNEVGILTDEVRFNSTVKKPAVAVLDKQLTADDALIAFPNDRPKSLRPWRGSAKCKTIFAGMPRVVDDRDLYIQRQMRAAVNSYYNNFVRAKTRCEQKTVTLPNLDYEVTKKKRPMLLDLPLEGVGQAMETKEASASYVALTPTQLYKIRCKPKKFSLDKVARYSVSVMALEIENPHDFSIRLYLKSQNRGITFVDGQRKVVDAASKSEIKFIYQPADYGRNVTAVDIFFNECQALQVGVTAEVVTKFLTLDTYELDFAPDESEIKFVVITNPLNVPTKFKWEVPDSCYKVEPMEGSVEPKNSFFCMVTFSPVSYHAQTDFILIAENGTNRTVKVGATFKRPDLRLQCEELVLEHIPLNIPVETKFVVKNESFESVNLKVVDPNPLTGVSIEPQSCIVNGRSNLVMTIRVELSALMTFVCAFDFLVQMTYHARLIVSGCVEYPDLVIKPSNLSYQRMMVNADERVAFFVENESSSPANISFDFDEFPDFYVSTSHERDYPPISEAGLDLEPKQLKELFLHLRPLDVASYNFFLPYVFNHALGPPTKRNPGSFHYSNYTKHASIVYANRDGVMLEEAPKLLKVVKTTANVTQHLLNISADALHFTYFPNAAYRSILESSFAITNVSKHQVELCLQAEGAINRFHIATDGATLDFAGSAANTRRLEPSQKTVFGVKYCPSTPDDHEARLHIFVKEYQPRPFNHITLTGNYPRPTIVVDEPIVCLTPVPLKCRTDKSITLKCSYHRPNCRILYEANTTNIFVDFTSEGEGGDAIHADTVVRISYVAGNKSVCNGRILFCCLCPATCEVLIKTASENCLLTSYAFLQKNLISDVQAATADAVATSQLEIQTEGSFFLPPIDDITLSEKSSGTTEPFLQNAVDTNETSYPYFPCDNDCSDHADFMRRTASALENWVYEQGFCKKSFFSIPEGIAARPVYFEPTANEMKQGVLLKQTFVLHYVQLLTNLCGPTIQKAITQRPLPNEKIDMVAYIYSMYNNVLEILAKKEACLAHVQAEHLLEYDDYIVYMRHVYPEHRKSPNGKDPTTLRKEQFLLLAKQSWIDLLLQTLNMFVVARVRTPSRKASPTRKMSLKLSHSLISTRSIYSYNKQRPAKRAHSVMFMKNVEQAMHAHQAVYSKSEVMLLYWLEYHYEQQREKLFDLKDGNNVLEPRRVLNFETDLMDGLVLATTTVYYCPYLAPQLKKMHPCPKTEDQCFLNAYRLVKAWRSVRCSFGILPRQIVKPNSIQMLLLVAHLYEILPSLSPTSTVTMLANLSQSVSHQIPIENCSNDRVRYAIELFGADARYFDFNPKQLEVAPKKRGVLDVTFHAKKVAKCLCTLVFCGDYPAFSYAKSIAVNLEGIPDVTYYSKVYHITTPVYQVQEQTFQMTSPYAHAGIYTIYTASVTDHIDNLRLYPWKKLRNLKMPFRMYSTGAELVCDEDGVGSSATTLCAITPTSREFVCYFLNEDIGDFSVKVVHKIDTRRTDYETVDFQMTRALKEVLCDCKEIKLLCHCEDDFEKHIEFNNRKDKSRCARVVLLKIPRKNNIMWKFLEKAFVGLMDESEKPFWDKYLGTSTGNRLMKCVFYSQKDAISTDMRHIFNRSVNYNVIIDKTPEPPCVFPQTFIIDDVFIDGHVEIQMHLNTNDPFDFFFEMHSEDGSEIRYYKVHFVDVPTVDYNHEKIKT